MSPQQSLCRTESSMPCWQPNEADVETVAQICHEANQIICIANGDLSQLDWALAPEWQKESVREGARYNLRTWIAGPEESHDLWMRRKLEEGWRYGRMKNILTKEHPCLLPRRFLPREERVKDDIFCAICQGYRNGMSS